MATKTPYATSDLGSSIGQTLGNFIDASSLISVPNTTIVGRAQIVDPSKDLKCSFGVERIQTQAIYELQNEFGPNGERVFGALNDDRGLIRYVGTGWYSPSDTQGTRSYTATLNDYVEVTFYGTGLNVLTQASSSRDLRATVDGGSEGANFVPNGSTVLQGRNYAVNVVVSAASGLSPGIHTVKIRLVAADFPCFGFEVLNTSSTFTTTGDTTNTSTSVTSLASTSGIVPGLYVSGTGIPVGAYVASVSGTTLTLSAAATATNTGVTLTFLGMNVNQGNAFSAGSKLSVASAYKQGVAPAGFTNTYGTAGTRGGRVLVYLDSNGSIKKDIQYTNTAQANLSSADHTNEEVIRTYHYKEFGAGRSDDFSTTGVGASTVNRTFTLDDGTTTLVCDSNVQTLGGEFLGIFGLNGFVIVTFVGTGLDIIRQDAAGGTETCTVTVDGSSIGSLNTTGSTTRRKEKIISGLPYGTHTVKFQRTTFTAFAMGFHQFIVYGPKKPALPTGAIELADYNIMANFVANGTASNINIAAGVLRKLGGREIVYVNGTGGTFDWTIGSVDITNHIKGYGLVSDRANSYCQYTFFGTGFEYRFYGNNASNVQISLNGTNLTTTNFPTANYSFYGTSVSFNTGTGILNLGGAGAVGGGLAVYYLPLGLYTVKINNGTAGQILSMDTIDVITPIHSPKANLYADLQNTLPVGSCALSDNRRFPGDLVAAPKKAWAQAIGIASGPTTTSTGFVPCPDMSLIIKTSGGPLNIAYAISCYPSSSLAIYTQVYVDGVAVGYDKRMQPSGVILVELSDNIIVPVAAGVHKIDLYWRLQAAGTLTADSTARGINAREI